MRGPPSRRLLTDTLLVRYGELALKSPPVRREFETRLKRNLLEAFLQEKRTCTLSADHGHVYVHTADAEEAIPIVRRTFGVVSVSPARTLETDVPSIVRTMVEEADRLLPQGSRFAVRARRTGTHPFTSQALAAEVGAAILEKYPDRSLKVDLTHPAVELYVEVRGPKTYLYHTQVAGPGGLPLGVAGKVGAFVDSKRGALGAYLLMKRGCRTFPVTCATGLELCEHVLQRFDTRIAAERVDGEGAAWALLRERALQKGWDGVALPLDVADYPRAREFFGETVIFSPTVGLSDAEVERDWSAVEDLLR